MAGVLEATQALEFWFGVTTALAFRELLREKMAEKIRNLRTSESEK